MASPTLSSRDAETSVENTVQRNPDCLSAVDFFYFDPIKFDFWFRFLTLASGWQARLAMFVDGLRRFQSWKFVE